jgi:16S rRNA (cytidine1402-2'-O)-methyltransferase
MEHKEGLLAIVATPIGNMGDLSFRALWNLRECSAIYAEDTRVIAKILAHYGLKKSVFRLDAATELKKAEEIEKRLESGERVCYVCDAGTPGISDPGGRLVAYVRARGLRVEAVPGASALTAAISVSGLSISRFVFWGFLPHKKGRETALKEIAARALTSILYESPHRIQKLMHELARHAPERRVSLIRELTKIHEEVRSGKPEELATWLVEEGKERGEFVVIVEEQS